MESGQPEGGGDSARAPQVRSNGRRCGRSLRVGDTLLTCELWWHPPGRARHQQTEPWGRYLWDRHGNVSVRFTTGSAGNETRERARNRPYRPKVGQRRGR